MTDPCHANGVDAPLPTAQTTPATESPSDDRSDLALRVTSQSPVRLVLATLATLFVTELFVMLGLSRFDRFPWWIEAVIDAVMITTIASPVLYYLTYLPLCRELQRLREADARKELLIRDLQSAREEIWKLQGMVPICAWCKDVRDNSGYWHKVETYIESRSEARFSHALCPTCLEKRFSVLGGSGDVAATPDSMPSPYPQDRLFVRAESNSREAGSAHIVSSEGALGTVTQTTRPASAATEPRQR